MEAFHLHASLIVHWGNQVWCRALLHISRVHARQVQKSFCFWFELQFLDEHILAYSMLHIRGVEQIMLW